MWDFINTPCTVKKTYQGHVNKNYSVGGCFGVLRSMRKLTVTNGDEENEFREEQWEESDSVAFVTSASEDGDIVMWDIKSKEVLQRIGSVHDGVCFWVDVHGETGTMVSCGQDGRIVVFRHRYPDVEEDLPRVNGHVEKEGGEEEEEEAGEGYPEESEERRDAEAEAEAEVEAGTADAVVSVGGKEDTDVSMHEGEVVDETNGHEYPEGAEDQTDAVAPNDQGDLTTEV